MIYSYFVKSNIGESNGTIEADTEQDAEAKVRDMFGGDFTYVDEEDGPVKTKSVEIQELTIS